MNGKTLSILMLAAAPLVATQTHAQTAAGGSGFYGGVGAGRADTDIGSAGIAGSADKRDNAWKLFGGYQFNPNIAVEAGYADLGRSSVIGARGGAPAAASLSASVWQASAVGSLPLSQNFALTGKFGLAYADTDTSGIAGGAFFGGSDSKTAPTYGLGLRYDLSRTVSVRGEWERFRLGNAAGLGGRNDSDLYSVNAVFRF